MGRLQNKVVLITGGNSGIGAATTHQCVFEGARVVLIARRRKEGYDIEREIRAQGGEAWFRACDVTNTHEVNSTMTAVLQMYGRLDVVFCCAGGSSGTGKTFPDETDEIWDRVLDVNLTGTMRVCRAAWPYLILSGGGAIITMSSLIAATGVPDAVRTHLGSVSSASYGAAKAGVEALTRHMAAVGAPHNIRVNCVRPGQILTPRVTTTTGEHVHGQYYAGMQLLLGTGTAEDVARAVVFLASDDARFITGAVLDVTGGAAAKL